jgi:hypothetical protein
MTNELLRLKDDRESGSRLGKGSKRYSTPELPPMFASTVVLGQLNVGGPYRLIVDISDTIVRRRLHHGDDIIVIA